MISTQTLERTPKKAGKLMGRKKPPPDRFPNRDNRFDSRSRLYLLDTDIHQRFCHHKTSPLSTSAAASPSCGVGKITARGVAIRIHDAFGWLCFAKEWAFQVCSRYIGSQNRPVLEGRALGFNCYSKTTITTS